MTEKKINIAIVGGGFGGLALAIGLQKYPHLDVHVYEAAHKFAEVGAGVVLGPNALKSMDLIDPRIRKGFERRAAYSTLEPDENGMHTWMTVRKGQNPDALEKVIEYKHELRGCSIHRAHFLDELVQLVKPDSAHFGKRVERIYESDAFNAPIVLQFKDGTFAETDVLIGADGVHSPTRRHILGPDDPAANAVFTGSRIYRAIVPVEVARAKLDNELRWRAEVYCGRDGLVVGFPLSDKLYNLGITVFNTGPWTHSEWIVPADVSAVKAHFADWDPWVRKNVEMLPENGTQEWSTWDMPPARVYAQGRVAIMGDAAHATTPYQGAGAGQAIEDAAVLSALLGHHLDPAVLAAQTYPRTAAAAAPLLLSAYDSVRRLRSQKVVVTSRAFGQMITGGNPNVSAEAAALGAACGDRQGWIWSLDPQVQISDAMLLYEATRASGGRKSAQHPA